MSLILGDKIIFPLIKRNKSSFCRLFGMSPPMLTCTEMWERTRPRVSWGWCHPSPMRLGWSCNARSISLMIRHHSNSSPHPAVAPSYRTELERRQECGWLCTERIPPSAPGTPTSPHHPCPCRWNVQLWYRYYIWVCIVKKPSHLNFSVLHESLIHKFDFSPGYMMFKKR